MDPSVEVRQRERREQFVSQRAPTIGRTGTDDHHPGVLVDQRRSLQRTCDRDQVHPVSGVACERAARGYADVTATETLGLHLPPEHVGHDIDRLRRAVAEQEELIRKIDALETERREAVTEIAERLTGSGRLMTIAEILGAAHGPERERLRTLRERILAEISRIQKINDTNAYLIGSSLELVEGELSILSRGEEVYVRPRQKRVYVEDWEI